MSDIGNIARTGSTRLSPLIDPQIGATDAADHDDHGGSTMDVAASQQVSNSNFVFFWFVDDAWMIGP